MERMGSLEDEMWGEDEEVVEDDDYTPDTDRAWKERDDE